jgi:hypothetical protein
MAVFVVRLILGFTAWFVMTQLFYLATNPLPYYEDQVLIGGHRGTWTSVSRVPILFVICCNEMLTNGILLLL